MGHISCITTGKSGRGLGCILLIAGGMWLSSCAAKKPVKGYTIIIKNDSECITKPVELRDCHDDRKCRQSAISYRNDPACVHIEPAADTDAAHE